MDHLHRLIAFTALLLASSLAFAHADHVCTGPGAGCTEGEAYNEAREHGIGALANVGNPSGWSVCTYKSPPYWYGGYAPNGYTCQQAGASVAGFYYTQACGTMEGGSNVWMAWPVDEPSVCMDGCEWVPDGGELTCGEENGEAWCIYQGDLAPTGNTCDMDLDDPSDDNPSDPNDDPPLPDQDGDGDPDDTDPDRDGDGDPNDTDPDPNDPDVHGPPTDSDGDGIPDQRDPFPNDPTNGGSDPGQDDGDSDNSAGGGGTCGAAPTCSGDGILCGILYQQWRTRCDAQEFNSPPSVHANGDDTSQVRQSGGTTDLLIALGSPGSGGGSCPEPPTFAAFGATYELPFTDVLCPLFAIIGPLIVVGAYVAAARIVLE